MKKSYTINKMLLFSALFTLGNTLPLLAQQNETASTPPLLTVDANAVLVFAVAILAMVIAVLGYTLRASLDLYKKRKIQNKNPNSVIKSALLFFISFASLQVFGQSDTQTATPAVNFFSESQIFRYLLLGIIILELITIFALVYWIRFFTGIEEFQREKATERKKHLKDASSWWSRFNKLKPMEEEASLDVGHSYDGIKELDNATPPWFTIAFIASFIFAIGYLWRYHVASAAPNQYEEYEIAVTKAHIEKEAYLKLKGDAVNENTVIMLNAAGIESGKALYGSNCAACHGKEGQGGVGPNLTDAYWLHGGDIGSIFKTIKLGVVEKGMMSWKDIFSAEQIAELSSYIKSIEGSNPPGAKEPQGELYKEIPKVDSSTVNNTKKSDSIPIAKL